MNSSSKLAISGQEAKRVFCVAETRNPITEFSASPAIDVDTHQRRAMLHAKPMPAPTPLISVIVVCKNPGPCLVTALESLWSQQSVQPEIIVVDGLSSDGTPGWLESQRARLSVLISESDRGVYDAMNKGIAVSTGDWILFLGADDRLAGDSVLHAAAQHLQLARADVAVAEVTYDDGRVYRHPSPLGPLARNFIHHQGAFYRRTLFDAGQNFDMTFRVMGDYELNLRFLNRQIQSQPLPLHLTICGSGGISDAGLWLGCTEEIKARHRHAAAWRCWPWDILSIARFLRKRAVRLKRTLRRKAI